MSEIYNVLQKIANIEEKIYILNFILGNKKSFLDCIEQACVIPKAPLKPATPREKKYPKYDEEKYLEKAKKQEKGKFAEFRAGCMTLAGGIFCSAPLVGIILAAPFFALAILSYPFAIMDRRKTAHKIYVEECEKLKREYENEDFLLEQYEADMKNYQASVELYKSKATTISAKKTWIENLLLKATSALQNLIQIRESILKSNNIGNIDWGFCDFWEGGSDSIKPRILLHYFEVFGLSDLNDAFAMYDQERNTVEHPYWLPKSIDDVIGKNARRFDISWYSEIENNSKKVNTLAKLICQDIIKNCNINELESNKTRLEQFIETIED